MKEALIRVNLIPIGKPRMTQRDRWKKRPTVLRYHAWKDELKKNLPVIDFVPDRIIAICKMPMPKSWSKKKQDRMEGKLHDQKPDADNILKAITDTILPEDKCIGAAAIVTRWATHGEMHIILRKEEEHD